MRSFTSMIPILAGCLLVYFVLVLGLQRRILFPRHMVRAPASVPAIEGLERIWVGPESDVEAWYLPAPERSGPAPLLIFTHGNGEIIDHWAVEFQRPRSWGVAVLLVEYPGYGRSGGSPSERTITEVMLSAYDQVVRKPEVDPYRVVAYGRSLGSGAACALAGERDVAALILESAFTGVRPLALRMGVPGPLVLDPFDNLEVVSGYSNPVLIIHGEYDRIIPAAHGRELDVQASDSELHLLSCGHNDCERPWALIRSFMVRRGLLETATGDSHSKGIR